MSMSTTPPTSARVSLDKATVGLCLSGAALLALIALRAGPMLAPARADLVASIGDYTMLTFDAGNDDVLLVMDSRAEQLFAYRVRNQNSFELIEPYDLKDVFIRARRLGTK